MLSVDGPPQIHDECRRTRTGEPTHERVITFLHALRDETECRVRGSSVVRSGWGLAQATEYLRSLPIDLIKAQAVSGFLHEMFAAASPMSMTREDPDKGRDVTVMQILDDANPF